MVVVVGDALVTFAINKQLKRISTVLEGRHAVVIPEELDPEDRIVIWHKDDEPPPAGEPTTPDSPAGGPKPIVGLE